MVGRWSFGSGRDFGVVVVMLVGTVVMKRCDVGWMRREGRKSDFMGDANRTNVTAWCAGTGWCFGAVAWTFGSRSLCGLCFGK